MASWGCLIALCGISSTTVRPGGSALRPRWQPTISSAFFTAAEGWGTLEQIREGQPQANGNQPQENQSKGSQTNRIHVKHGDVRLRELVFELPAKIASPSVRVELDGQPLPAQLRPNRRRMDTLLAEPIVLSAGQSLSVAFSW